MSLSAIIPSRNATNLVACVEAVRRHEPKPRIIIVDDGLDLSEADAAASSETSCWLCNMDPAVRMAGVKPFIFARNCNLGIAAAGKDDVILLNDDALLDTPGGFTAMQREAQVHPEFGIIGAVTNITGQPLQMPKKVGLREVPHFAFVCVLIPRRTIDAVGLLDERYCLDYGVEDRDYCTACTQAGLKCGVYDFCYVDHGSLVSTYRGDPKAPRSFQQNQALYDQKWGSR
jgi:GT2 family glycosyltransferase